MISNLKKWKEKIKLFFTDEPNKVYNRYDVNCAKEAFREGDEKEIKERVWILMIIALPPTNFRKLPHPEFNSEKFFEFYDFTEEEIIDITGINYYQDARNKLAGIIDGTLAELLEYLRVNEWNTARPHRDLI